MKHHSKAKETAMTNQTTFNPDFPQLATISADDFYKTYLNYMVSVARSETSNHYDADDVVSNVMYKIFVEKKCTYNPERGPFLPYLATMVRNEARSLYRKERHYQCFDEQDMERLCDENDMTCQIKACSKEFAAWIEEGIRRLRSEFRSQLQVDAYLMMVLGGKHAKDVDKILNVRPNYASVAKNRLHPRFQAILREIETED